MRLTTLHIQNDKFDILRIIKAFSTTVCTAQKAWEAHHANVEIYYSFDFEVSWQWKTCFLILTLLQEKPVLHSYCF